MVIRDLKIGEIDTVLDVLSQDSIRGYNGEYARTEIGWVSHFIIDENCFSLGLYINEVLTSVLISEKISDGGCIIWYISTRQDSHGLGHGTYLLSHFEKYVKNLGIGWIFLNGTENSLDFYKKNGFITSEYSKVYEHVKILVN